MKKKMKIRVLSSIIVLLAFILPILIQPAFVHGAAEQDKAAITINPSYNTLTGKLSVQGKITGGNTEDGIKVTIKILNPSNKLLYLGEEISSADGSFVFEGMKTNEEGTYKIYVGSEITEKAFMVNFKVQKETPVEPDLQPKPEEPGSEAGSSAGNLPPKPEDKNKPTVGQIKEKFNEVLESIDITPADSTISALENIIGLVGDLSEHEQNDIKEELVSMINKTIKKLSSLNIGMLAEKDGNVIITDEEASLNVEIKDEVISAAIKETNQYYKKITETLKLKGLTQAADTILSNRKVITILTDKSEKDLNISLMVKSIDALSSNNIDIVIDSTKAGIESSSTQILSLRIPSGTLDMEYILKYLKDKNKDTNDIEGIKNSRVVIALKEMDKKDEKEYIQNITDEQKSHRYAVYINVSPVIDLQFILDKEDEICIEKFNGNLFIEIPLDNEKISNNKVNTASKKIGVYCFNPDKKVWEYVGGRVNPDTGRMAFLTNHLSIYSVYEYNKTFKDIQDNWAREFIEVLASRHIINGVNDEIFQPERNVTRTEFSKMLLEALDLVDYEAKTNFTDVPVNAWYYKYVASAQKLGIAKGTTGNLFKPEEVISRQDMAVMAYRAVKAAGIGLPQEKEYKEFTDNRDISAYAKEAVEVLQQAGIFEGNGKGMFLPNNSSTRSEAAKIIYMLVEALELK
ncbi:MAG TPA: S-layer homology domain-containing protein [Clostridiales bacterium]|nr:S-layer homology domain-containing protein [Clostridiales bacterium]